MLNELIELTWSMTYAQQLVATSGVILIVMYSTGIVEKFHAFLEKHDKE